MARGSQKPFAIGGLRLLASQCIQGRDGNGGRHYSFGGQLSILKRVDEHFNRLAGVGRNKDGGSEQSAADPGLTCFWQAITAGERQLEPSFALVLVCQFL